MVESIPWQCDECKTCEVCKSSDDQETFLYCDDCDRGFHHGCLTPPLSDIPRGILPFSPPCCQETPSSESAFSFLVPEWLCGLCSFVPAKKRRKTKSS